MPSHGIDAPPENIDMRTENIDGPPEVTGFMFQVIGGPLQGVAKPSHSLDEGYQWIDNRVQSLDLGRQGLGGRHQRPAGTSGAVCGCSDKKQARNRWECRSRAMEPPSRGIKLGGLSTKKLAESVHRLSRRFALSKRSDVRVIERNHSIVICAGITIDRIRCKMSTSRRGGD